MISTVGPGAIVSVALVAPVGMALAMRAGISPFLAALMIANGANAGNLSPLERGRDHRQHADGLGRPRRSRVESVGGKLPRALLVGAAAYVLLIRRAAGDAAPAEPGRRRSRRRSG